MAKKNNSIDWSKPVEYLLFQNLHFEVNKDGHLVITPIDMEAQIVLKLNAYSDQVYYTDIDAGDEKDVFPQLKP